jgi:septum formation protein
VYKWLIHDPGVDVAEPFRLILASASPRRLELLRGIGLAPLARPSDLPEDGLPDEAPLALVARLAEAKGRRVAEAIGPSDPPSVVLAADTEVVLDGRALGKPSGPAEARRMLRAMRGRVHEVITGVFLLRTDDGRSVRETEITRVKFLPYDERTIAAYVATGEPMDKAGAYGIQGGGARLVERVEGSWTNVVGLPVEALAEWLARIGIELNGLVVAPRGGRD